MSTSVLRLPQSLRDKDTFGFFEDWESNYVTGDRWTPLTSDSSSASTLVLVLATTGVGGVLSITQDATDNDEIYFGCTKSCYKIAANKPCYYEARGQYAEGATNANNVIAGWCSTFAANTLIDDGGGPVASATMALIYKVDGGTVWKCVTSNSTTQTISTSLTTAGGSSYQKLVIEARDVDGSNFEVTFFVNDQPLLDSSTRKAIKHTVAIASSTEMQVAVGIKLGAITNNDTLSVDYIYACQTRV